MTGKYRPLYQFLAVLDRSEWSSTFTEIERILDFPLPPSAHTYPQWWENDRTSRSRHARAWLEAGWETRDVNLDKESMVFVRADDASRKRSVGTAPTRKSRETEHDDRTPSAGLSEVTHLLDYSFVHAAVIEPDKGDDGAPLEFMPQSRYYLAETTHLNRYGAGPFCRFAMKDLPPTSGIYALTIDGVLAYVGIANNLAQRWGPQGFATVSPRNCYVRGQSTNCKVNNGILLAAREGRRVDLWMYETSEGAPVEAELIRELDPPWNSQNPSAG